VSEASAGSAGGGLPHAMERVDEWGDAWARTGRLVLLLDFDGTLAPIVQRPELAAMPPATREVLDRLLAAPGVEAAIVSGRGMADARERAGIRGIPYAGNHGMEIEGPGVHRIHPEAAAARPSLESVRNRLSRELRDVEGTLVEDKGLTLSVHYRLVDRGQVPRVRDTVAAIAAASPALRVTEGKEVLEVRPRVDWDKGRAVEFLLDHLQPDVGVPVLYLGDDTTDEDAFRALRGRGGAGVLVADLRPARTSATSYLRDPSEVAELFSALLRRAPE
jgi:trehalose 6-phosphate phosphatase